MESESYTALLIGLGCIILIFFVLVIVIITSISKRKILEKEKKLGEVEKQRQIDLFHATTIAEENEKSRIARNLHDEIIPIVALTARNLNHHISELEHKGVVADSLKNDVQLLTNLSENIRDIAHDLIPKLFTSFGLIKSIEAFIKQLNDGDVSAAEFQNSTIYTSNLPFSKNDQLIIYRICLEILNNLFKHAEYDYLKVSLEEMEGNFVVIFAHDGKSITNSEINAITLSGKGIGLKSLQSRAYILNAKIDYSIDGGVSYIKVIIPTKKDEETN